MENNIDSRVCVVEARIDNIENRIDDLSSLKDAVLRLVVVQELAEIRNKKLDESYAKQIEINTKVNSTLENINSNLNSLNIDVKELKNKTSWDFLVFFKTSVMPILVTGGVFYLILKVTG